MPFGLKNADQTFQRFIDDILASIPHVFIHLDDVLVAVDNGDDEDAGEAQAGH